MDGWSVTQQMIVYKGKKSSNQKSKLVLSTVVVAWLSKFKHHIHSSLRPIWAIIWLQTLVAIDSESRLTSFPSFCAPPSELCCSIRI